MILDRKGIVVQCLQPLYRTVVQVDMGGHDRVTMFLDGLRVDTKSMILAGDLGQSGIQVEDGMVDAPVSVVHLVGLDTQGTSQDLMAETDAEYRAAIRQDGLRLVECIIHGCRITGPVGQEEGIGLPFGDRLKIRR